MANIAGIMELYTAYFNRAADKDGVDYWANEMDTNAWTLDDVASSFAEQVEYTALYAGKSPAEIVALVYTNVLNRTADTDGATYWETQLTNGAVTVSQLIQAVVNAATEMVDGVYVNATDAAIVNNKTAVSQAAYDGGISQEDAKNISLSTVTATDNSAALAAVDAVVNAGETFTLTQSAAQAQYELNTTTLAAGTSGYIALELAAAEAKEAAIAAGATLTEINDALAEIVAANAAALTLVKITALADANTAVDNFLATVDAKYDNDKNGDVDATDITNELSAAAGAYNAISTVDDFKTDGSNTAAEIADIHTANVAALNAALTIQKAIEAAKQAEVDVIDGLQEAIDAAAAKATAYTAAFVAEAATERAETMALAAADAASTGTVTVNSNGTILDTAMIGVVTTDGDDTSGSEKTETAVVTFKNLSAGQSVTVDGVTYTASADMLAAAVATAFKTAYDAATSTKLFTAGAAAGADITFTSKTTNINVANITVSVDGTEETNPGITALKAAIAADAAADKAKADAMTALEAAVQTVIRTENKDDTKTAGTAVITEDAAGKVTLNYTDTTGGAATVGAAPKTAALLAEITKTAAAEKDITDLEAAKVAFDAINAIDDALTPLEKAATDAATALPNAVILANADAKTGTFDTQDVYFINALDAGDSVTLSLNAVEAGKDYIFIGTDYTVNTDLTAGNNAVLEMFITEGTTEANTLLTFETKAFGSDSTSDFFTVELIGVATTDVVVDNGLITFA